MSDGIDQHLILNELRDDGAGGREDGRAAGACSCGIRMANNGDVGNNSLLASLFFNNPQLWTHFQTRVIRARQALVQLAPASRPPARHVSPARCPELPDKGPYRETVKASPSFLREIGSIKDRTISLAPGRSVARLESEHTGLRQDVDHGDLSQQGAVDDDRYVRTGRENFPGAIPIRPGV